MALLEPSAQIKEAEEKGDYLSRLALMEEAKTQPVGAVWNHYCEMNNVPTESDWLTEVIEYEKDVLSKRV